MGDWVSLVDYSHKIDFLVDLFDQLLAADSGLTVGVGEEFHFDLLVFEVDRQILSGQSSQSPSQADARHKKPRVVCHMPLDHLQCSAPNSVPDAFVGIMEALMRTASGEYFTASSYAGVGEGGMAVKSISPLM